MATETLVDRLTTCEVHTMKNSMAIDACTQILSKLIDDILPGICRTKEKMQLLHKDYDPLLEGET